MSSCGDGTTDGLIDKPRVGGQRPALGLLPVGVVGQVIEKSALGDAGSGGDRGCVFIDLNREVRRDGGSSKGGGVDGVLDEGESRLQLSCHDVDGLSGVTGAKLFRPPGGPHAHGFDPGVGRNDGLELFQGGGTPNADLWGALVVSCSGGRYQREDDVRKGLEVLHCQIKVERLELYMHSVILTLQKREKRCGMSGEQVGKRGRWQRL